MKVQDLLEVYKGSAIDVYDNYTEELAVAYCGEKLTAEGKERFAEVLEMEIEALYDDSVIIAVDQEHGKSMAECERRLALAKEMFYGMAGYCSESDFNRWFCEAEEGE